MWTPQQRTGGQSQDLELPKRDAQCSKVNASFHPEASNQPSAVDTELHSLNQELPMYKPTEQPELDCGITICTVTDSDVETLETASVQADHETANYDDCDEIIVTSDSDTKSSGPAASIFD